MEGSDALRKLLYDAEGLLLGAVALVDDYHPLSTEIERAILSVGEARVLAEARRMAERSEGGGDGTD